MQVASIVGARPQFIKVKPVVDEFNRAGTNHILVHTGQHYDYEMSKMFFDQLSIPEPAYNLEIGSHTQGKQTGLMLERVERVLLKERPRLVIVYGDTNSTLAGTLAAVKLHIPVAHVEAGLRSHRLDMPEEVNRVLTDRISKFLFCPTETAMENLKREGLEEGASLVGDVMYDVFLESQGLLNGSRVLSELNLIPKEYLLLTVHRAENTDNLNRLESILAALVETKERVVFPIHPRTQNALKKMEKLPYKDNENFVCIKPVGYLDMLALEKNARKILTDSGGVQKEAYWLRVPCITLRDETEWVETVESGWNILAGSAAPNIVSAMEQAGAADDACLPCMESDAASRIVNILLAATSPIHV